MLCENKFSVYLFLSYKKLCVKIADYSTQLGYSVYDGFATPVHQIAGIAIVDDQVSSELFYTLIKHCKVVVIDPPKSLLGPCEILSSTVSLAEFAAFLSKCDSKRAPGSTLPSYWLAHNAYAQEVHHRIQLAAKKNCSVLIHGESGTGKEVVAHAIHQYSNTQGAFIAVNCAAMPADLVESELFGHEKGAFTGAISQRVGKCELASKGTLFLDEIGDMPLSTQVKLLRVLQELSFERLGSSKMYNLSARVISATHQPLQNLIQEKKFRQDLYFRLNVIPINLPPLRSYPDEIPSLCQYLAEREQLSVKLSECAKKILKDYDWPGNIRQLINLLKRIDIFYSGNEVTALDIHDLLALEPQKLFAGPSFAS